MIDTVNGMSTPLLDGHYFDSRYYKQHLSVRLEAVDSSGNVISRSLEMPVTREERQSLVRQARLARARTRQRADATR